MLYEDFKKFIAIAYEKDITMETFWKLSRLSRDIDEFRENFAMATDKDEEITEDAGEE